MRVAAEIVAKQSPLKRLRTAYAAATIAGAVSPAAGQVKIEALVLDSRLDTNTLGYAGADGEHAGIVQTGVTPGYSPRYHPAVWKQSTLQLLSTPGGEGGAVVTQANEVLGGVSFAASPTGSSVFASLWVGPERRRVDLNPPGERYATVRAAQATQQVGYTGASTTFSLPQIGNFHHLQPTQLLPFVTIQAQAEERPKAMLWRGTPDSAVSLHPAGAHSSAALDTDGQTQVGVVDGVPTKWNGNAESIEALPITGFAGAAAVAVDDGDIAGYACSLTNQHDVRAVVWFADAGAPIALPRLGEQNYALDILDGLVVGEFADVLGFDTNKAVLWLNSTAAPINLHALLPGEFEYIGSTARSLQLVDGRVQIAGHATRLFFSNNRYNLREDAVAWSFVIPEPQPTSYAAIAAIALVTRVRAFARHRAIN